MTSQKDSEEKFDLKVQYIDSSNVVALCEFTYEMEVANQIAKIIRKFRLHAQI